MTSSTVAATPAATVGTPSSTTMASSTITSTTTTPIEPTFIFSTLALTTTFTPPPACTEGNLTMLERQSYYIWQNEPLPVPNTTFSECYPSQFMTSYLDSYYSTILPAFSPLVCPDNYQTVWSQSMTDRPLYIVCCPSNFGFHPPATSTPGRPAFGGTCYSDLGSTTVTQYDNASSSGIMVWSSQASAQAYAHPFDGFAMDSPASVNVFVGGNSVSANSSNSTNSFNSTNSGSYVQPPPLSGGAIAGIVIGSIAALAFLLVGFILILRRRKRAATPTEIPRSFSDDRPRYGSRESMKHMPLSEKALPPPPPGYFQTHKISELSPAWPRNPEELQPGGRYSPRQELPDHNAQIAMELDGSEASVSRKTSSISAWTRNPAGRSQPKSPLGGGGGSVSPRTEPTISPPDKAVSPISLAERHDR